MVYLIKSATYYKIGFSENLETLDKRFKSYKTHCPEFEVIGLSSKGRIEEKKLHLSFNKYRRNGTEWFEFPDNQLKTVKESFITCNSIDNYKEIISDWSFIERYGLDDVELIDDNQIEGELYTAFEYVVLNKIINIILAADGVLYLFSNKIGASSKKLYEIYYNNIETFFIDYSDTKANRRYSGIIVDGVIFYEIRCRDFGVWNNLTSVEDSPEFFNLIKPYLKQFKPE